MIDSFLLWWIMWCVRVWLFLLGILWAGKSLRWVWICLHNFFGIMWLRIYSNSFFRLFHRNKPWKLFNTYQGFLQLFSDWQPWFACSVSGRNMSVKKNFTSCDWKFIQTLFSDSSTGIYHKNSFNTYQGFLWLFLDWQPWFACSVAGICLQKKISHHVTGNLLKLFFRTLLQDIP